MTSTNGYIELYIGVSSEQQNRKTLRIASSLIRGDTDEEWGRTHPPAINVRREHGETLATILAMIYGVRWCSRTTDIHFKTAISSMKQLPAMISQLDEEGEVNETYDDALRTLVSAIRLRPGKVTLEIVQNTPRLKEADRKATESLEQSPAAETALGYDGRVILTGAKVCRMTQKKAKKILDRRSVAKPRPRTETNLDIADDTITELYGSPITTEEIWRTTRCPDLTRRFKNLLWKCYHGAGKMDEDWKHLDGYEERQWCTHCGDSETRDHVFTKCPTPGRDAAWDQARTIWENHTDEDWPEITFGVILGVGALGRHKKDGKKMQEGTGRLMRILISTTAHLIWHMRCEAQIGSKPRQTDEEARNRLMTALNIRLSQDCMRVNNDRFADKVVPHKLVLGTWRGTLDNEDTLPLNWVSNSGVLVGRAHKAWNSAGQIQPA